MTTDRGAQDIKPARRGVDRAGIVIAIALALLAAVIAIDASRIQASVTYGMGPQAVPYVIAIGLGVLAVGNLIKALRGDSRSARIWISVPSGSCLQASR